jgi:hypothetical protein
LLDGFALWQAQQAIAMKTNKDQTLFRRVLFAQVGPIKSRAAHCGDFGQSGLYSKAGGGESHCPTCRKLLCWQSEKKSPMLALNPDTSHILAAHSIFSVKTYCFIGLMKKPRDGAGNALFSVLSVFFQNNLVSTPSRHVH